MDFHRITPGVFAKELGRAARCLQDPEQNADGSGFTCPVGANKAINLTLFDLQIDPIQGSKAPKFLRYLIYPQNGHGHPPCRIFSVIWLENRKTQQHKAASPNQPNRWTPAWPKAPCCSRQRTSGSG